MKRLYILFWICILLSGFLHTGVYSQSTIYYVSKTSPWGYDIFSYNLITGVQTRLTTSAGIDNHPSISHYDSNQIVFSSNRGAFNQNEFNIFIADVNDIDGTARQLTDFSHAGAHQFSPYPNRHPHWHPNGHQIIFTTKNREALTYDTIISECSQPLPVLGYRYYEGMNVIEIDDQGNVIDYKALDPFASLEHFVGHPSFNYVGDKIVFSASTDGNGKNWEVYAVGYDPITKTLIPGTLVQVTSGPNWSANPIKLSGGASFNYNDSEIIFNSTRTSGGNSQIYSVPANSQNVSVENATRLTFNHGNDYVPEPLSNGDMVITSDLGPNPLCECFPDSTQGATDDLDVVLLQYSRGSPGQTDSISTRTVLGDDEEEQTLLLSDEVSWFCGTKPNLSSCTYELRIWPTWSLWLERYHNHILLDLLKGYGSEFSENARELYGTGWENMSNYMQIHAPEQYYMILENTSILEGTFPGWNSPYLQYWMITYDSLGGIKFVVPSLMHGVGIGDSCTYTGVNDDKGDGFYASSVGLFQNYPNPFSDYTTIEYELKQNSYVSLKVYDLYGHEIATLVSSENLRGKNSVNFYSEQLQNGIYYVTLITGNFSVTRKMVIIR